MPPKNQESVLLKPAKYNLAEIVIGVLLFLMIDLIALGLDLTGIGSIIAVVLQSGGVLIMNLWALSKGDKNSLKISRQIIKYLANVLPILPTCTLVFLIDVFLLNYKIFS